MSRHRARLTWQDTEPVRLYLYGVLVPVVALLVALGVVDDSQALLWLAIGAAALGVGGVERARSLVDSPATRDRHRADVDAYLDQAAAADGFTITPAPRYDDV